MKKFLSITLMAILLTSCYKDPQSVTSEGKGFEVEFLFEKDGIKVYRFFDGGRHHYFTSRGETISNKKSGKSTRQENIY
jgi:hypothetical protein